MPAGALETWLAARDEAPGEEYTGVLAGTVSEKVETSEGLTLSALVVALPGQLGVPRGHLVTVRVSVMYEVAVVVVVGSWPPARVEIGPPGLVG